jgi:peptidoglycan lytic transglycosylase
MSRRAAAALALVLACSVAVQPHAAAGGASPGGGAPSTTKQLDHQRSRVAGIGERIEELTGRLSSLIAQLRSLDTQVGRASTGVANATAGLKKAEQRAVATKAILSARAREAYKRGAGWRNLAVLLEARSVGELLSASRLMGDSIAADRNAYDEAVASAQAQARRRDELTQRREELFASSARLQQVRAQTQAALASEQQILANAQAELAALEERRRREEAALSGDAAARRTARQIELDRKLESLLGWIDPSAGPATFMPDGLRSSEVTTTGLASWYGPGFHGRRASSGATYRQEQFTAASLILPFGTFLKVTRGPRSAVVVITDRGPYVPGRVLDLSLAAAQSIGLSGIGSVSMEILVPAEAPPQFP